jgi:hypothetical protein
MADDVKGIDVVACLKRGAIGVIGAIPGTCPSLQCDLVAVADGQGARNGFGVPC